MKGSHPVRRVLVRIVVATTFAVIVTGSFPGVATGAPAAPIDILQAKAKALEAQIATTGAMVAALGEHLNAAQLKFDAAQSKIADAEARIAAAKAEMDRLRALVAHRAAAIYRGAIHGGLAGFEFSNAADANARTKYGQATSRRDNAAVANVARAKADLAIQRADAEHARGAAQTERDNLAATKAQADAAAAQEQRLLGQVHGQLGDLVRQAQARREAAAALAAPRPTTKGPPSRWTGPVPNPSGGAAAAVAFARAQLGKPYQYAATGPDTYDCSGLTMRAWQAGGLSLPHYSGAQAALFPPVPLDQLQPGDLITTSSWSAHVGIWVGGGYIHATHTGDVIRFVAGSGSVRAAVRPG